MEFDAYVAGLVQDASSPGEALVRAVALGRKLALQQARLRALLKAGRAPATLAALEQFAAERRGKLPRVAKLTRRLGAAPARQRGPAERMFRPDEVAREVGVDAAAVAAWCELGLLRSEGGKVPNSALAAYRTALPRWKRLESLLGDTCPDEEALLAELGR